MLQGDQQNNALCRFGNDVAAYAAVRGCIWNKALPAPHVPQSEDAGTLYSALHFLRFDSGDVLPLFPRNGYKNTALSF